MANNEYINRVDYGNDTLIDISDTTAEAGDVIEGKKVYLRSGAPAIGSLGDATQTTHGLMSVTDKVKLDNIEEIDPYITLDTPTPMVHISDAAAGPIKEIEIGIEPKQDFNGYDHPWPAGSVPNMIPNGTDTSNGYASNKYLKENGTIGSSNAWYISEYFLIEGNIQYTVSTIPDSGTISDVAICFYDSNKTFLDSFIMDSNNLPSTFTTTANAVYCRASQRRAANKLIQMEKGSSATTVLPYSNICPISGHTECNVMRTEKNIETWTEEYTVTNNNIELHGKGNMLTATNTASGNNTDTGNWPIVPMVLIGGQTYTFSIIGTGISLIYALFFRDDNFNNGITVTDVTNGVVTFTPEEDTYVSRLRIRLSTKNGTVVNINATWQLETGDTATTYEAFVGNTYSIAFPQSAETIYGGKLTAYGNGSGELSIDKKFYHLTADDTIGLAKQQISGFNRFTFMPNSGNVKYNSTKYLACDKLPKVTSANPGIGIFGQNANNICFLSDLSTVEAFKEWLTEIGGLDIVYELATPITYQLTIPQVQTILSENNIWANSGNINKLIYGKNINGLINGADKVKLDNLNGGIMKGASVTTNGIAGMVPNPVAGDQGKFLKGDGTWENEIAIFEYGVATIDDICQAYDAGKALFCVASLSNNEAKRIVPLAYHETVYPYKTDFQYYKHPENNTGDILYIYTCTSSGWTTTEVPINPVMTAATASAAGTKGLAPAPPSGSQDKFLSGDGTYKSGGLPMVILKYGISTWDDFINAYNNNVIVYCRASSNSNPASSTQGRMAFMAYVNNASSPTEVEFQYYRSISSHTSSQMGDQVFIYKLNSNDTWSVTTREASLKQLKVDANDAATVTYSSNVITLKGGLPKVTASDNGKILQVVDGVWTAVTPS